MNDDQIKPEGLPNHVAPSSSHLEPMDSEPQPNNVENSIGNSNEQDGIQDD